MTVEAINVGSLPDELDASLPAFDDVKKEGDDHIRNIKICLINFYSEFSSLTIDTRLAALEALTASATVYDAARLGGQLPAFYLNAGNMNAGTLPVGRLSGTYSISISGTAAVAAAVAGADVAGQVADAAHADLASYATNLGAAGAGNYSTRAELLARDVETNIGWSEEKSSPLSITISTSAQRFFNETFVIPASGKARVFLSFAASDGVRAVYVGGGYSGWAGHYLKVIVGGVTVLDMSELGIPDGGTGHAMAWAMRLPNCVKQATDIDNVKVRVVGGRVEMELPVPVNLTAGNVPVELWGWKYRAGSTDVGGAFSAAKVQIMGPRLA